MSDSLRPHGLKPIRLLSPWKFPGKSTGVGSYFLLLGIFPTQGLNLGLLHCRQTLYHLRDQGSHYKQAGVGGAYYQLKYSVIYYHCPEDCISVPCLLTSQIMLVVKHQAASAGVRRNVGRIPESGSSPGGEHSNPLQYPCLENPMNRGVWWATVHRVAKNQTRLKWLKTNAPMSIIISYFSFLS